MEWTNIEIPWLEKDGITDFIIEKANIIDVLEKFDIEYTKSGTGEFTHKLKCPFHANGDERTPSMFVNINKNNFYCFSCSAGGNIINFVSMQLGIPFYEATNWILNFIGASGNEDYVWTKKEKIDPHKTVLFQVFEAGKIIRDYIKSKVNSKDYNKWIFWADDRFKRLDCFLDNTQDDDWEIVNKYKEKVINFIGKNK